MKRTGAQVRLGLGDFVHGCSALHGAAVLAVLMGLAVVFPSSTSSSCLPRKVPGATGEEVIRQAEKQLQQADEEYKKALDLAETAELLTKTVGGKWKIQQTYPDIGRMLVCEELPDPIQVGLHIVLPFPLDSAGVEKIQRYRQTSIGWVYVLGANDHFTAITSLPRDHMVSQRVFDVLNLTVRGPQREPPADWSARAKDPDWRVRNALVEELWPSGHPAAIPILIELMADEHKQVANSAANALDQGFDDKGISMPIEPVVRLLRAGEPQTRANAAYLLGVLQNKHEALDALLAAAQDPDPYVRGGIYGALGGTRDKQAIPLLVKALREEKEAWLRQTAASALYGMGLYGIRDKAAVDALILALEDREAVVRRYAARALQTCGDESAVAPLMRCLDDPDKVVRGSAAFTLGFLGDPSCGEALVAATYDRDGSVRSDAVRSLGWLKIREAVPRMLEMLADSDEKLAERLITALGEIGDPRATEHLVRFLRQDRLREVALRALEEIADPKTIGHLLAWLRAAPENLRSKVGRTVSRILWKNSERLKVTDEEKVALVRQAVSDLVAKGTLHDLDLYSLGLAVGSYDFDEIRSEIYLLEEREGRWQLLQRIGIEYR